MRNKNKIINELSNVVEESDAIWEDIIDEMQRKKVIRKGKLVKKLMCKPGKKALGNKCVVMKAAEKAKRRRMAKKGAIKRKAKFGKILKKRAKALRKRKTAGLDR
jgi:hypothetical protein|tara:strand:- start:1802 stop:2116 length:315 start_codon:yes stop_codon:yes gene_type:complete